MTKSKISRAALLALAICALLIQPVASQPPSPDPRFGAVEAFRDPVAAAEAGVGWERILFYWSELQPNGPEDWNGYHVPNEWLTQAAAAGREVVAVLKHTPAWATDGSPGCGIPRGLDLPVDDPGNTWAVFVRRTTEIYKGRINHWIIWNEPDIAPDTYGAEWCGTMEEYYQLLKTAYLAAHQANPDVTIHLAGLTRWHDHTYLQRFLSFAAQDPTGPEHDYYFDVVSLHIYFQSETIPTIFGETQAALAAHSLQKPIWLNETNAPPNSDPLWSMEAANYEISLEEQASFLLQSFALALSQGAERIAVYKWMDNDLQPNFEPFGIIRPDYSRRPAYDAYRLITTHYAGAASARKDRQSLYTVITLERGSLTTRILWTRTEAEATMSVAALSTQARLIDQTGAEQIVEPVDGQYTLTLPGARCADTRGCIIGGPTYLLVEETNNTPPSTEPPTPTPTELLTITSPLDTPTPLPTATVTLTLTPTPIPTDTPTHPLTPTLPSTSTSTPTPTSPPPPTPAPTFTPIPTPTPWPSVPTTPSPPAWPLLAGLAAVMLFAALIGTMFKHQS